MSCTLPDWFGLTNRISISPVGGGLSNVVVQSNDTFAYPPPTLTPSSLHVNATGIGGGPSTNSLIFYNSNIVPIVFDGTNFGPSGNAAITAVYYGNTLPGGGAELTWQCSYDATRSTTTAIACFTEFGSNGANMVFTVLVGTPQTGGVRSVVSTFSVTFPITPSIASARGCTTPLVASGGDNTTTVDCPTEGNIVLTIRGKNLFDPLSITVGGSLCLNPTPVDTSGTAATCLLPAGTGPSPVVVTAIGVTSNPATLVFYAGPVITQINGCGSSTSNLTVVDCNRLGGDVVVVTGDDLGPLPPTVIVGGTIIPPDQLTVLIPHRSLSFIVPSSTGLSKSILIAQPGGGAIGASTATLSYRQCVSGYHQSGLSCIPCEAALFSSIPDADRCQPCSSGFRSNQQFGSSQCVACEPGKASESSGTTACSACSPGRAQGTPGQSTCPQCVAGKYSNVTGATACVSCEVGSISSVGGATTCELCRGIRSQIFAGQTRCTTCTVGNFFSPVSSQCKHCPEGSICNETGIFGDGPYYVYFDAESDNLVAQECLVGFCQSCVTTFNATNQLGPNGTIVTVYVPAVPNVALNPISGGQVFS